MAEPPGSPLQHLFALNGLPEDLAYDNPERAHSPPLSHLPPKAFPIHFTLVPITSPLSVMPAAFPVPTGGPSSSCLIIPRVRHACQMILERMDSLLYSWGTQHTQVLTEALLSITDSDG